MSDRERTRWRGVLALLLMGGAVALMIMSLPGWGWCLFFGFLVSIDL